MYDLTLDEIGYILSGHIDRCKALSEEQEILFRSLTTDLDEISRFAKRKRYETIDEEIKDLEKRYTYWVSILREKGIDIDG